MKDMGEFSMSFRSKLEENSEQVDMFPELSPLQKLWNRFVVWLGTIPWKAKGG